MTQNQVRIHFALVISTACVLTVVASLLASVYALPPRPTPAPTATPTPLPTACPAPSSKPAGGFIELRVQFPPTWPWTEAHWQELWTVVQWQDEWDAWHDVEEWRGGLESVTIGESGEVVGERVWWVAEPDLGKGPFRWRVYRDAGGELLVTSEQFYLPDASGQTVTVEVSLMP